MEVSGAHAIVTGGASGLGAATAKWLGQQGAVVSIVDVNEASGLNVTHESGGRFLKADVRDEEKVSWALDEAWATYGPASILVNCAGVAPSIPMFGGHGLHPADVFRSTLETNLVGTFLMTSRFAERLAREKCLEEERGVIINTASITAFDGHVGHCAYAASKAAVVGMTLPMARELCAYSIRVMAIAPGLFDTPMLEGIPGIDHEFLAEQVPHPNRMGKPDEFAALVEAVIRNPMLNGEVIRLDAALRLGPQ